MSPISVSRFNPNTSCHKKFTQNHAQIKVQPGLPWVLYSIIIVVSVRCSSNQCDLGILSYPSSTPKFLSSGAHSTPSSKNQPFHQRSSRPQNNCTFPHSTMHRSIRLRLRTTRANHLPIHSTILTKTRSLRRSTNSRCRRRTCNQGPSIIITFGQCLPAILPSIRRWEPAVVVAS